MKVHKNRLTDREGVSLNDLAFTRLGFLFREQTIHDLGIDAHVELVEDQRATGQLIGLQIKTGDSYTREVTEEGYIFRSDDSHMQYWLNHALPVVVTQCNPADGKVYWQLLTERTVTRTGKGWKALVPIAQEVDQRSLDALKQVATRVVPSHRYTVLSQQDTSWAGAKRYSLDVLLNGSFTKAEVAQVIRQIVTKYVGSKYYRDSIVESHWGESDAHVIFLFVYVTLDDRRLANWICRSLWVDETLPKKSRPLGFDGENIGEGIVTEWSDRYSAWSELSRQHTMEKGDYLRALTGIMSSLRPMMEEAIAACSREKASGTPADEVLQALEPRISQIYDQGGALGFAPVECKDVDLRLQSLLASAHNLVLPFSPLVARGERDEAMENRIILDYRQQLERLQYELEKIR